MVDRPPRRLRSRAVPQQPLREPLPAQVAHAGARLVFVPVELTRWQRLRRRWNDIVPHTTEIGSLFLATDRRHHVRLNWRNPFAIPFVLLVVVLSPLLLIVAVFQWIVDKVTAWRRVNEMKRSIER